MICRQVWIDLHQVLKAISNVLSGCLSHVAIVVIIKPHVRVFDSLIRTLQKVQIWIIVCE